MRDVPVAREQGQALPLFTLIFTALVLAAAVAVDGGYAFAQRRLSQNAADLAAMAGARVVGEALTGRPWGAGSAANVEGAIRAVLTANQARLVDARYVDEDGHPLGDVVGASVIPDGTFGVVVDAEVEWHPFLLGSLGIEDWAAGASATAITSGHSLGGGILPLGIQSDIYDALPACPLTDLIDCVELNLTNGTLNMPGGFGWLSFGIQGRGDKCPWLSSLGMTTGGCETNQPFLDSELGPPPDTHGCCTAVGLPDSEDKISSLTGNEWGDISYYVENRIPVWVPIWDEASDTGANGWYHIVGFGAIVLTGDDEHARWVQGAAVDVSCAMDGHGYCAAPGGSFTIEATGSVRLVR